MAKQKTKVNPQTFEMVGVNSLHVHPANPRQGDVGAIYESIEHNGFYGAIIVQRSSGAILAGNHRYMAAVQSGITEVPVLYVDVDDDRALRILLADNRTNDKASYDNSALAEILSDLANTSDLLGTGYDGDDLDELIASLSTDQGAGESKEESASKNGSLADRFGVPPFTVLNAREGWWQDRKRAWLALGIRSEVGRGGENKGTPPIHQR